MNKTVLIFIISCYFNLNCFSQEIQVLKGEVSAKLNANTIIPLSHPSEVTNSNIANDPYIYPYEKVQIIATGNVNLNPCDYQKKTDGFLGFGRKRYTERRNYNKSVCDIPNNLKMKLGSKEFTFSGCKNNTIKSNVLLLGQRDGIQFENHLSLMGFISKESIPKCTGTPVQHDGKFELKIIIYPLERYKQFKKLIQRNKVSIDLLDRWLNNRLKTHYRSSIVEDIAKVIEDNQDSGSYSTKEKIQILEYINREIKSGNISVNSQLGKVYLENGNFSEAISANKTAIEILKSEENQYLLNSVYYSNKLAVAYENLAIALIEKELRTNQDDLNQASSYYGLAAQYYLSAFQYQKAYKCKLNEASVLKRINDVESLIKAQNIIANSIGTFDKQGLFYNLKREDEIDIEEWDKGKLIIDKPEALKLFLLPNENYKCNEEGKDCEINLKLTEFILKSSSVIEVPADSLKNYKLNIIAERIVIGSDVEIRKLVINGSEYGSIGKKGNNVVWNGGAPAPKGGIGGAGRKGKKGESSNLKINISGNLYYFGKIIINVSGGQGGKGQQGGQGGDGLGGQVQGGDIKIPGGDGGQGGNGGDGGEGGDVIVKIDNYTSLSKKQIASKINVNSKGGEGGLKGEGGPGGIHMRNRQIIPSLSGKSGIVGEDSGKKGEDGKYLLIINNEIVSDSTKQ